MLTMLVHSAAAQTESGGSRLRFSMGISTGHYRYDPGIAAEVTSPPVFQGSLSLRIRASVQWLEAYKSIHDEWLTYHTYSAALVYNHNLSERARFFAELGVMGIAPDIKFSSERFVEGFYQLNGLEIALINKEDFRMSLWFGVGPAFIDSHADRIEGRPSYGNGLHYLQGLRFYF